MYYKTNNKINNQEVLTEVEYYNRLYGRSNIKEKYNQQSSAVDKKTMIENKIQELTQQLNILEDNVDKINVSPSSEIKKLKQEIDRLNQELKRYYVTIPIEAAKEIQANLQSKTNKTIIDNKLLTTITQSISGFRLKEKYQEDEVEIPANFLLDFCKDNPGVTFGEGTRGITCPGSPVEKKSGSNMMLFIGGGVGGLVLILLIYYYFIRK